jgi:hypothetical protein
MWAEVIGPFWRTKPPSPKDICAILIPFELIPFELIPEVAYVSKPEGKNSPLDRTPLDYHCECLPFLGPQRHPTRANRFCKAQGRVSP